MVPNQKTTNVTKATEAGANKQSAVAVNMTKTASVNQTVQASSQKSIQNTQTNSSTVKIQKVEAPTTRIQLKQNSTKPEVKSSDQNMAKAQVSNTTAAEAS